MKNHIIAALFILAGSGGATAAVVYTEGFTHSNTTQNQPYSAVGWSGYLGPAAGSITSLDSGDRGGAASPLGPGGGRGYAYTANSTAGQIFAAVETNFGSPIQTNSISWQMGNTSSSIELRLLVRQGSQWYATSTVYSTAATASAAIFASTPENKTLVFTTTAAAWQTFTFNPGTSMSLGSVLSSDLTSSQIDGIGFYVVHPATLETTMRFDNLSIDGTLVPEPSAALLGALGAVGFCRRRR